MGFTEGDEGTWVLASDESKEEWAELPPWDELEARSLMAAVKELGFDEDSWFGRKGLPMEEDDDEDDDDLEEVPASLAAAPGSRFECPVCHKACASVDDKGRLKSHTVRGVVGKQCSGRLQMPASIILPEAGQLLVVHLKLAGATAAPAEPMDAS